MAQQRGDRRRFDRVTAPDLLDGLTEQPQEVLRALRDDCRDEETRISYLRRVVQGQLDVAQMELERRRSATGQADGARDDAQLVKRLSAALADQPSSSNRQARTMSFYAPEDEPERRSGDTADEQQPTLGQLPDLDDERIEELCTRLRAEEAELSQARRVILHNLDGLQSELVRRYREGSADLDAILHAALPRRPQQDG